MKIREHYIKFTGMSTKHTYHRQKQQYARMFQKQLRQCNFILKCKPYNSLVLQVKTTNANKMLITQRLCAFLALAQLLEILFFFSFALYLILIRKKAT